MTDIRPSGPDRETDEQTLGLGSDEPSRVPLDMYRLLVASVRDYAIFMLDPGGHIVSWNLGAERIKGYEAPEILGRHFSTFYPQEDVERDKPGMELKIAEAVGRFEDEGWRRTKDGSRFWANVVITALGDDSGVLIGYAKVTRDLTVRRAAEMKAMEDTREFARLDAANRAKNELLAGLSHELRTPLNAIAGYVDLLIHGVFGDMPKPQRSNVATIVAPLALAHAISIDWQPADPTAIADADPARVEQIVVNLVTNAIKYTESGGHAVSPSRRGTRVPGSVSRSVVTTPVPCTAT